MPTQPRRNQRFRIVGSGFTLFSYNGSRVKFCTSVAETAPRPVTGAPGGGAAVGIQPLDALRPIEIVFPRAVGMGTLVLTIQEEWEREVWRQFTGFKTGQINDLADVLQRSSEVGGVACTKVINPPPPYKPSMVVYHGCVITDIDMSETVTIDRLVPGRNVTINYTHRTIKGR